MPVLTPCPKCGRTLPNSTTVCACQGGSLDEPRVPEPPRAPNAPIEQPRIGMPVISKCRFCGRTLSNSLMLCPCRSTGGGYLHPCVAE